MRNGIGAQKTYVGSAASSPVLPSSSSTGRSTVRGSFVLTPVVAVLEATVTSVDNLVLPLYFSALALCAVAVDRADRSLSVAAPRPLILIMMLFLLTGGRPSMAAIKKRVPRSVDDVAWSTRGTTRGGGGRRWPGRLLARVREARGVIRPCPRSRTSRRASRPAPLSFTKIVTNACVSVRIKGPGVGPHAVHLREFVLEVGQLAYKILADWYG